MKYIDYVRNEDGTPVINITHAEAEARCKELGGHLPTMAEAYYLRALEVEQNSKENLSEWTQVCSNGDNLRGRGGSWIYNTRDVRASIRIRFEPTSRNNDIGFRCVGESVLQ